MSSLLLIPSYPGLKTFLCASFKEPCPFSYEPNLLLVPISLPPDISSPLAYLLTLTNLFAVSWLYDNGLDP